MWVSVFIGCVCYAGLFYKDYRFQVDHRKHEQQPDRDYVNDYCKNAKDQLKYNTVSECHNRRHRLTEDPQLYGLYDVLETRGFCAGYACNHFAASQDSIFGPITKIVTIIILIVLLMLSCGVKMGRGAYEYYGRDILPFFNANGFNDNNSKKKLI